MERIAGDKMADTQPQLERGQEVHIYHYPPPVPCRECGGAGTIALLVTADPCAACEGSGWIQPPARHECTPGPLGYYRRKRSFDDRVLPVSETQWFEPVGEAPRQADAESDRSERE
jgi:hypothetical protein